MYKALGAGMLLLVILLVACGHAVPTLTPTAVEWYSLAQASDLSHLQSYHARYAFRWEGLKDGKRQDLTWDVLEEYVKEPPARRFLWSESAAAEMEFIQIGHDAYINAGSGWMAISSDDTDIFKGRTFLNAPLSIVAGTRARLVERNVTINSVPANRYAFDETTLGPPVLGEVTKAKGDVWVSSEFGVIVKYEGHYEGSNLTIGGGEEGVLDAAFDLLDINKPITIQPPLGTKPAAPEDIPIVDDATAFTAISGIISYKTAKAPADVAAFYEAQMAAVGWTKIEGPGADILTFTKGSRTAQVLIEAIEGRTNVMIMTTE